MTKYVQIWEERPFLLLLFFLQLLPFYRQAPTSHSSSLSMLLMMLLLMILHLYIISVGCYVPAVWYNVGLFRKKNTVKVIFVVWSQQIKAFDVAQESVSIYSNWL